jgi:hypothetical protein
MQIGHEVQAKQSKSGAVTIDGRLAVTCTVHAGRLVGIAGEERSQRTPILVHPEKTEAAKPTGSNGQSEPREHVPEDRANGSLGRSRLLCTRSVSYCVSKGVVLLLFMGVICAVLQFVWPPSISNQPLAGTLPPSHEIFPCN